MDFRLSDQTLEWKTHCRKFAREVIRPVAPKHDRDFSCVALTLGWCHQCPRNVNDLFRPLMCTSQMPCRLCDLYSHATRKDPFG